MPELRTHQCPDSCAISTTEARAEPRANTRSDPAANASSSPGPDSNVQPHSKPVNSPAAIVQPDISTNGFPPGTGGGHNRCADKPDVATVPFYVLNSQHETLSVNIGLVKIDPYRQFNYSAIAMSTLFDDVPRGDCLGVELKIETDGFESLTYTLKFAVRADAEEAMETTQEFTTYLVVRARASTQCTLGAQCKSVLVRGRPALGTPFAGVKIQARDFDGVSIKSDGERFGVELRPRASNANYRCSVAWDATEEVYTSECKVGGIIAGNWSILVSLDGVMFSTVPIRMQCPIDQYENSDGLCEACRAGTNCNQPGSVLETLRIINGFWRSGSMSKDVRKRFLGVGACSGSNSSGHGSDTD